MEKQTMVGVRSLARELTSLTFGAGCSYGGWLEANELNLSLLYVDYSIEYGHLPECETWDEFALMMFMKKGCVQPRLN